MHNCIFHFDKDPEVAPLIQRYAFWVYTRSFPDSKFAGDRKQLGVHPDIKKGCWYRLLASIISLVSHDSIIKSCALATSGSPSHLPCVANHVFCV